MSFAGYGVLFISLNYLGKFYQSYTFVNYCDLFNCFQVDDNLLHLAVEGGDIARVRLLLEKTDQDPNRVNEVHVLNDIIVRIANLCYNGQTTAQTTIIFCNVLYSHT